MATDSQRIVQLPVRGQPNVTPTSSSKPTEPYTLETIYSEALSEVESLRASGRLPELYYDILTTTKTPTDLLFIVDEANERRMGKQSQSKHALYSTVSSTVKRLDRYAGAIDMLAQSSPQAFGLNVVGLIWGSLKVLLIVAQDVIDTFEIVVQTLKDVESSLPITETLTQIYGSSEIQLLRQPLIDIYKAIISLGLGVVKLCDQGSLQSLGRSTWTSLQGQFKTNVAELTRAAQLVQRAAQLEHMCATQKVREIVDIESRRQESFRREILRNSRQPVERGPLNPVVPSNTAPLGFLAPQFTGRDTELAQLKMMLSQRSDGLPARCSIVGMPGLGKTQLALKYASQIYDPLTGPVILWTSAATTEKLTAGYSEVLNLVDHVDRDHTDQGLRLRTTRRWLESARQEQGVPWLLIFDNVNEDTVPFLREYLPQTNENLAMLFTMRSNDVAQTLLNPTSSAEAQAILHVDVPNPDDARDLLLAVLEAPNEVDAASQIAKAETLAKSVGYLPLAINQVATFAKQHSKNLDYILSVYQDQQDMDIMKWDNQLSAYEQRSVMAAFSSSLDDLAKASPVASLLLQTLSFFDPESIPLDMIVSGAYPIRDLRSYSEQRRPKPSEPPIAEEGLSDLTPGRRVMHKIQQKILRRSKKVTKKPTETLQHTILPVNLQDRDRDDQWALKVSELLEHSIDFPKAVRQLRLLAFVAHKSDACGETIRIHDLVRSMIRYNARHNVFDPLSYRMAAAMVDHAFHVLEDPRLSPVSWPLYENILPHYRSIVSFQEARDGCNIEVVRASIKVTDYLSVRGRYSEAVQTIEAVMPVQQKWLGRMDVDYLATLTQLAKIYMFQWNYDQAESLFEQVSKARVATLGATHLDTLDSMRKLANIYKWQQRCGEASSLQELVLSHTTKRLGADHEVTLFSQYQFGQIHERQGNFVKAELIYEDTLRSMEKTLSTSDYSTLRVLCDLGMLKHKLQHFDEADVLLTRALAGVLTDREISWTKWLAEDPLGELRRDQGRFAEARVLLKASLADIEKMYGTEHVLTADSLVKLAWVYVDMRRFADAEPLLRRAVNIIDSSEEFNLESFDALPMLAFAVEQQNRVAEAEGVYRKVWDVVSQKPDSSPLTTIICAASLSRILYAQERTQEAEPLHERALNSLERALIWLYRRGIYDTNDYWHRLVTIGRVLEDEGMSKIALKVQEEKIGFTHPVTQQTLQALVAILRRRGKAEEEEALVQRCKEAGFELRLPEDAEAPGLGGGDSGAESAGQGVSTVQADEHASGEAAHGLYAGEEIVAGS